MKKSEVFSLDEVSKANKEIKFTKNEAREWINVKIKRMAKDRIGSKWSSDENPMSCIAKYIYECLVSEWQFDNKVLEASRAVGLDEAYVLDVIAPMFDSEGNPIKKRYENTGDKTNAESVATPTPYYASMITLDKAHDTLIKARKPGSKDLKLRKKRKMIAQDKVRWARWKRNG